MKRYLVVCEKALRANLAGVLLVAVVLLGGCSSSTSGVSSEDLPSMVDRYCMYGAESEAQLEGCKKHVTVQEVRRLETNAAYFAKGELHECLPDSGPFCSLEEAYPDVEPEPPYGGGRY